MVQKIKNIAFIVPQTFSWKGEENYFRSLLSVLDNNNYKIFFFSGKKGLEKIKNIKVTNLVCKHSLFLEEKSFFNFLRKVFNKLFKRYNPILILMLKLNKIDYISHSLPIAFFKNLTWFPDFQHLILKENFTKAEKVRRDKLYVSYIKNSQSYLVSSNDSKNHFKTFIKKKNITADSKINVLKFVPYVDFSSLKKKQNLFNKYKIKKNYVYVPNQFWKHKNHKILINTVDILNKQNFFIKIILSGTVSNENKNNFIDFFDSIKKKNLNKNFSYLGEIPHKDVLSLIYHADLVINPSYFEGWSTTVEEAKILNKKILLSNISVHKEQKDENTYLFDPQNSIQLSKLIKNTIRKKKIKFGLSLMKKKYLTKRTFFKKRYFSIIEDM